MDVSRSAQATSRRALIGGGLTLLGARAAGLAWAAGKPVVTVYKSPT